MTRVHFGIIYEAEVVKFLIEKLLAPRYTAKAALMYSNDSLVKNLPMHVQETTSR